MSSRLPRANSSLFEWACALALPLAESATLIVSARINHERFDEPEFALLIFAFMFSFPGQIQFREHFTAIAARLLATWIIKVSVLLLVMMAIGAAPALDRETIMTWGVATPAVLIAMHELVRYLLPRFSSPKGFRRLVMVGATATGRQLASVIREERQTGIRMLGFFDDRSNARLQVDDGRQLLGALSDVADYVRKHFVDTVIITLPMASHPRTFKLIDSLRDTTASIYFAPDVFVFNLIQGRTSDIGGVPVVAVCETPFYGVASVMKRLFDLVCATVALILLSPLLLGIAAAVRLTSVGPILFRQRRYGLDGREVIVYKFRTMTVQEDGDAVKQAHRHDPRITPLGAILRRTSLDELPQLINVIQGRMSLVGPRPHAVAHNEEYRRLINGYMIRHKVKPGITGWAQVNGARGETDTVEKMRRRIEYDLEYLRNWSLRLDLYILLRTLVVVSRRENAY